MRKSFTTLICSLVYTLLPSFLLAQGNNHSDTSIQLSRLDIKYMLRGYFYASSNIADTLALGGFGKSDNRAKAIDPQIQSRAENDNPVLLIDTANKIAFAGKFEGYRMILANRSGKIISFPASDSRLSITAEVFIDGTWQPIEYLPSSWCGNSHHTLFLKDNECWEFSIPRYYGKKKVKLRYKMVVKQSEIYYSNEIDAYINRSQLVEKEGHKAQGIMDPYND